MSDNLTLRFEHDADSFPVITVLDGERELGKVRMIDESVTALDDWLTESSNEELENGASITLHNFESMDDVGFSRSDE